MHPSVTPLAAQLRLQTQLLLNCLDGVDGPTAERQRTGGLNSIAFLVAHLVESRHFMVDALRAPLASQLPPALATARSIDEAGPLPPIAALVAAWERVSAHLAGIVERLDTPVLADTAVRVPGSDGTVLGALAFLVHHEAYHLGQIGLLRRLEGLAPMSYALAGREPGRQGA